MNVLFVSQCTGNALTETRRLLDQFAERRSERSWQTPITQEGLQTVHLLLRKTARRSTSVACLRLHRDRSELLWIVGNARRFNEHGAIPTDTTARDMLRGQDENDWRHGEVMCLLASLAGLCHDLGKASIGFQAKLKTNARTKDAYRHEWVSLRLFVALVGEAVDDAAWLGRLARSEYTEWEASCVRDGLDRNAPAPLKSLPPLARAVGWLILGHHRLPVRKDKDCPRSSELQTLECSFTADWGYLDDTAAPKAKSACWTFPAGLPWDGLPWRERAARIAQRLLRQPVATQAWLDNPFVMHLSRLSLMLADHYTSSLPAEEASSAVDAPLYANTDTSGRCKQPLGEHLVAVSINASRIGRGALPRLERQLPRIARHRGFRRRTEEKPFLWQNRAFDLAESLRSRAVRQGFFGVNMASTGTGKTMANGRILYALAEPQVGARFTVALGLRVLTLQTGDAYRQRLKLGAEDLAVLVGGSGVRELHQRQQEMARGSSGSESAEGLLPDETYVHFEGSLEDGPLRRWLQQQPQALLQAPIVVCTIDHLVPATEGICGGRQILPMLRLLAADLVLDEVDDFDIKDLPAVSRLVHWAGLLGSRVLLSSATLPPSLVQGLFQAYLQGRKAFQASRGEPGLPLNVCCAWFDEFACQTSEHNDLATYKGAHEDFVGQRLAKLAGQPQRRRAVILPLSIQVPTGNHWERRQGICQQLAGVLRDCSLALHRDNCQTDPRTGKQVSIGLIRMANIDPLVTTACQLAALGMPEGYCLHLCVYHAQFPLYLRANIEERLDRLLKRSRPEALLEDKQMQQWLTRFDEQQHIFVVMASPVAELGRDHDYDWSIIEPSSMRSNIQIAGRVRRHRLEAYKGTNINLFSTNIKRLEGRKIAYCKPGYESNMSHLKDHDLRKILRSEEIYRIDASPRIQERWNLEPTSSLVDLEHYVIKDVMLGNTQMRMPVSLWWETKAHLSGVLQAHSQFRSGQIRALYRLLPDEDGNFHFFRTDEDGVEILEDYLCTFLTDSSLQVGQRTVWWEEQDDRQLLEVLANSMDIDISVCARQFAVVELPLKKSTRWCCHPKLGIYRQNQD